MIRIFKEAIVTHEKGSWRWQERHAISLYGSAFTRDDRLVWKFVRCNCDRLKPRDVRRLTDKTLVNPMHLGSLLNAEIPHSLHCRKVDVV